MDASEEQNLPDVAGEFHGDLLDFIHRCRVRLAAVQRCSTPDNELFSILCDSVRLARAYTGVQTAIDESTARIRGIAVRTAVLNDKFAAVAKALESRLRELHRLAVLQAKHRSATGEAGFGNPQLTAGREQGKK